MQGYLRIRGSTLSLLTVLLLLSTSPIARGGHVQPSGQSPIDIEDENVRRAELPPLLFDYAAAVALNVVNTGSPGEETTVRADVPAGGGSLTLDGVLHELRQFHFHVPSEHTFNGARGAI